MKKLAAKQHLNSDEFRSLGIGILGTEIYRTYFQKTGILERVYPGCPAALAGMKLGDEVLDEEAEAEDARVKDPTRPSWMFTAGIEGDKVDYNVSRHSELITFHPGAHEYRRHS